MTELMQPDAHRCNYFFLYDGSKVKGEGDLTREGICYFYPEERPLDEQELLCGQLAGAGRCVSELSSSPVRILRLRRNKFAIRMKDDFFWALGCSVEIPTITVCELLDQLINLFRFYNGSVRRSYQLHSHETLASRWAQYLSYLQSGSSELHHIFSCLRTIDATNIDPLLLLKAALILQACQRCPLVSAGCILFRGRVVSTQISPELTMKVMVHESETYTTGQRSGDPGTFNSFGGAVISTTVFLTVSELQYLQSAPVDKGSRSRSTTHEKPPTRKTPLSRTLSDAPSTESEPSDPVSPQKASPSDSSAFSTDALQSRADPTPQQSEPPSSNAEPSPEAQEGLRQESDYQSFHSNGDGVSQMHEEADGSLFGENSHSNGGGGDGDAARGTVFGFRGAEESRDRKVLQEVSGGGCGNVPGQGAQMADPPGSKECPLIPMALYLHRVKGLVLALLVEPCFLRDTDSMEEVYHGSLASLNGLEAHLRTISPGASGPQGPYLFAHFDCVQSTLTISHFYSKVSTFCPPPLPGGGQPVWSTGGSPRASFCEGHITSSLTFL
ncbi:BLOC-3 complex member HPS4 isoform 2-T2 [Spinachia spinachia]